MVNEVLELDSDNTSWKDLFPELHARENDKMEGDDAVDGEGEDDSEDEDFVDDDDKDDDEIDDEEDDGNEDGEGEEEEGDEEDEEGDEEEDEEGDEEEEEEDEEEPMDEDEVQDLLQESGLTKDEINSLDIAQAAAASETMRANAKYNLRQKLKTKRAVLTPFFSTDDIGRLVARVRRGYLILGKVSQMSILKQAVDDAADGMMVPVSCTSTAAATAGDESAAPEQAPAPIISLSDGEKLIWTVEYDDDVTAELDEEDFR
jgi:hypothetical protein